MKNHKIAFSFIAFLSITTNLMAYNGQESDDAEGPYSTAMDNFNPRAVDAAIAGFIGPDGRGVCPPGTNDEEPSDDPNSSNYINPVFSHWANNYALYIPAPAAFEAFIGKELYRAGCGVPAIWRKPECTLGEVTGDNFDVCVLGDLDEDQINVLDPANDKYASNAALDVTDPYKIQPGFIILCFAEPITNGPGPDFAVFENGFISAGGAGVGGQIFAELAYIEVSTDGNTFIRFPSVSLTEPVNENGGTGAYGTIDPSNVFNLAGKHVNAYESSWGTPFNLNDLLEYPEVISGIVNLNNINFVKVVDIPGNGFFNDMAQNVIDPATIDIESGTGGTPYLNDHGIHDAWLTWGSGGHDLEAIGAITQIYGDANSDGSVNLLDFLKMASFWNSYGNWPQGDFNEDRYIDIADLELLAQFWQVNLE